MKRAMLKVRSEPAPVYAHEDQVVVNEALAILARRLRTEGVSLTDPKNAGQYVQLRIGALEHEVFACIFLDSRHRVIEFYEISRGTIDGAEVHPREIVKRALQVNAAALLLTHNHPSGALEFSAADRAVTVRVKAACALIDVRVLDHILVTAGGHLSLATQGGI